MPSSLGLVGLLVLAAIPVRVDGPAPCALDETTQVALERYLGKATLDDVELELSPSEDVIELSLLSEGRAVLTRRIELSATACEAVPDAAALIVERYFRDLGWTPGTPDLPRPPAPEPSPTPEIPVVRPPPPPVRSAPRSVPSSTPRSAPSVVDEPGAPRVSTATTTDTATTTRTSTVPRARTPLDVAFHLGAEARGAFPLEIGAAAKLELSIEWFRFTTEAAFARPESWIVSRSGVEIGRIQSWVASLDFGLGACWSGPVRLCGRGSGGFESVFGTPSGDIFQRSALVQAGPRLGLGVGVEWPIHPRFELVGSLLGIFRPVPAAFTVEDADEADYSRPKLSVLLGVGFRSKIF